VTVHYLCIILIHFGIRRTSWELEWIVPFGLIINKKPHECGALLLGIRWADCLRVN